MEKNLNTAPKDNKTERARRFFKISTSDLAKSDPSNKYLKCEICNIDVKVNNSSNIVPHLKRKHPGEYIEFVAIGIEENLEITRLKLIQSCVEMVSVNGKTFSTLSCSGFVNSHQATLDRLKAAGQAINLKDAHLYEIKQHLNSMATKV